jgi:type IV pilus assembly protein PilN
VALLYYNIWLGKRIDDLNTKIKNTKIMLTQAETQSKKVDKIKKELEKLEHKKTSISTPDTSADNDNKPVKRLWFKSFDASGGKVNIKGIALDNKTIADFMSRLEESKLYNNINLKTIKQQKVNKLNLKSFEIGYVKASLKKPEKKTVVGSKPGKK